MAKGFPYFKFTATEWLTGDIAFEDFELQGIFINVCALYWHRDGKVTLDEVLKRLKNERIHELTDRFISVNDGFISVSFLDEQLIQANHISKQNSENGKKGGRPKPNTTQENKPLALQPLTELKPKKSKEEEEQEGEVDNKKNIELPYKSEQFKSLWDVLIRSKKWKKKADSALILSLKKLSRHPENVAIKMMEDCIAGEWQGLVEPTSSVNKLQGTQPLKTYKIFE